ncbi:MAG: hypothetical protein ACI90V_011149 [Bacillariaceae sp.]|jgi:hypothetical protein
MTDRMNTNKYVIRYIFTEISFSPHPPLVHKHYEGSKKAQVSKTKGQKSSNLLFEHLLLCFCY